MPAKPRNYCDCDDYCEWCHPELCFPEAKGEKPVKHLSDHDLVLAIRELLDGTEWDSETASDIADILREGGYPVREPEETIEAENAWWGQEEGR